MFLRRIKVLTIGLVMLIALMPGRPVNAGSRVYRIRLASIVPPNSHWQKLLQDWQAQIEEKSDNRIEVVLINDPVAGGELEIASQVQRWAVECGFVNSGGLSSWLPEIQVFEIPYFWESAQEVYYVIDHFLGQYFAQKLNESRLELLGWSENGWQDFFAQTGPINAPVDLIKMKAFSRQSDIRIESWRLLKAKVLPLPLTGVIENFARADIDAGEATAAFLLAAGWTPYVKYYTQSRHIYEPAVLFCNKRFFDNLPQKLREVLKDSGSFIEDRTRTSFREIEAAAVEKLKNSGVTVTELTAEQQQAFAVQLSAVRVKYTDVVGRELVDKINLAKAALGQGAPK